MVEIETLFQTKTAKKTYPLAHNYIGYMRDYPPPRAKNLLQIISLLMQARLIVKTHMIFEHSYWNILQLPVIKCAEIGLHYILQQHACLPYISPIDLLWTKSLFTHAHAWIRWCVQLCFSSLFLSTQKSTAMIKNFLDFFWNLASF